MVCAHLMLFSTMDLKMENMELIGFEIFEFPERIGFWIQIHPIDNEILVTQYYVWICIRFVS